jgi:hypothetical protein
VGPPEWHTERPATNSRYPWAEWSDGQWRQAVAGEDYTITGEGFRSCLYAYARAAGLRAASRKNETGVVFRLCPERKEG